MDLEPDLVIGLAHELDARFRLNATWLGHCRCDIGEVLRCLRFRELVILGNAMLALKVGGRALSFLMSPRVAFSGRFLADVSTINNANPGGDVGWNPQGGAAFEFLDVGVTGGWDTSDVPSSDPVLGCAVSGRPNGSSAKMVDLDPDWQNASELWALSVRFFDASSGDLAFMGRYVVASFRDIWMRQCPEVARKSPLPNGQPMGARYVSTLADVRWGPAADRSGLLAALRRASPERLSIAFHQFGYFYAVPHARYRTGTLIGTVGPWREGDAETAAVGRRLQPVPLNPKLPCLGAIDFEAAPDGSYVSMDLGHALPIANVDGALQDLGAWPALPQLAGCQSLILGEAQPDFATWGKPSRPVQSLCEAHPFGTGWYPRTGGVVSFPVDPASRAALSGPLALYGRLAGGELVAITREVSDGLFVRADRFVFRMEPGETASATLYAARYGAPAPNVTLYLSAQTPLDPPALRFPASVTTDGAGRAVVQLQASDPGSPRKAASPGQPTPDGQVYIVDYSPLEPQAGAASRGGTGLSGLDALAVHVRQSIALPEKPTWEDDVQPIMAGYAALYPIMSAHLFDLADYGEVVARRAMLLVAFGRDIDDPNYMPVTRDLSASKLAIILKWLRSETGDAASPLVRRVGSLTDPPRASPRHLVVARTLGDSEPDTKRDGVPAFPPISTAARQKVQE